MFYQKIIKYLLFTFSDRVRRSADTIMPRGCLLDSDFFSFITLPSNHRSSFFPIETFTFLNLRPTDVLVSIECSIILIESPTRVYYNPNETIRTNRNVLVYYQYMCIAVLNKNFSTQHIMRRRRYIRAYIEKC